MSPHVACKACEIDIKRCTARASIRGHFQPGCTCDSAQRHWRAPRQQDLAWVGLPHSRAFRRHLRSRPTRRLLSSRFSCCRREVACACQLCLASMLACGIADVLWR